MLLMLASFLFLPLLSPSACFLFLPLILERFLSTKEQAWGPFFHYSAVIAPLLASATISAIENLNKTIRQYHPQFNHRILTTSIPLTISISSILVSLRGNYKAFPLWQLFNGNIIPTPQEKLEIQSNYAAIELIPKTASVRAQDSLLPHLSQREQIYLLTEHYNDTVDYVLINPTNSHWPIPAEELPAIINKYLASPSYGLIYSQGNTLLFRKNSKDLCPVSKEIKDFLNHNKSNT